MLPRSFYVDHDLPSQDAQNQLVTDTVERYCRKGYQLYVKTHPRDTTDYEQLLPDAVVLDRFMPSELLDYCFEVRFARAVGLCTASVRNLQCADEKISLDYDYIAPYQRVDRLPLRAGCRRSMNLFSGLQTAAVRRGSFRVWRTVGGAEPAVVWCRQRFTVQLKKRSSRL